MKTKYEKKSDCPYCGVGEMKKSWARARLRGHTLHKCGSCGQFAMRSNCWGHWLTGNYAEVGRFSVPCTHVMGIKTKEVSIKLKPPANLIDNIRVTQPEGLAWEKGPQKSRWYTRLWNWVKK